MKFGSLAVDPDRDPGVEVITTAPPRAMAALGDAVARVTIRVLLFPAWMWEGCRRNGANVLSVDRLIRRDAGRDAKFQLFFHFRDAEIAANTGAFVRCLPIWRTN